VHPKKRAITVAVAGTAAGAIGLGLVAMPAGAGDDPQLPAITAEELVESALRAETHELAGTIEVDNDLGLPSIPGMPALELDSAKVFNDGEGRSKLMLRQGNSDRTIVHDGTTVWTYSSADNSATKLEVPQGERPELAEQAADPTAIAAQVLGTVRESSTISVDGTATVAGRAAYELVLTPRPDERTLLREVRVAVDSGTRMPLRLEVMVNGTTEPALSVGFSEVSFTDQPADLFRFSPPPGATVTEETIERDPARERAKDDVAGATRLVGEGWDRVLVTEIPDGATGTETGDMDVRGLLEQVGTPVSGPFGSGYVISTNVVTALVTDDGRVAAGAVPEQVLMEALTP
jgi:outer membrane lipoprotein-sorting protein